MRHKKSTNRLHRTEEERRRLWIDLTTGLIKSGKIVTFTTRAKWFRPKFERLVTLCKRAGDNQQLAFRKIRPFLKEDVARKLIEEIVPKYVDRQGGYTAQYKLSLDFSSHDQSVVMLVD